jgi:nucleoside 2-deoxyribosyltransferase
MYNKPTIYLSGGMNQVDWQSSVESAFEDKFIFFNPRKHNLEIPKEFTIWDLYFVRKCDIVLAYMEKDNPSGFGLTLEVGLALGLNKTIILIDEKSKWDKKFAKQFQIVRESVSIVFEDYEKGISFLDKFNVENFVNA